MTDDSRHEKLPWHYVSRPPLHPMNPTGPALLRWTIRGFFCRSTANPKDIRDIRSILQTPATTKTPGRATSCGAKQRNTMT
jgi:hypothetical protein